MPCTLPVQAAARSALGNSKHASCMEYILWRAEEVPAWAT